jgi:hypothetical protein
MTKSKRQPYGLGSFVKKFTKPIKKVLKSPIGKAALLGGLGWAANAGKLGGLGSGWLSKIAPAAGNLWSKYRNLKGGQQALLGLGALAVGTPLWQKMMKTGPYQEIEEEVDEWDVQPSSIANIMGQAKDYYRNYDPYLSSLNYMPAKEFVNPTFYSAKGGLAKLANGGGVAEAQAEQMLKMEYQKYRNQGGTMSYQQFKMTVLKQAQGRGPLAQGQPQMMNKGGRIGKQEGGLMDLGGMEKDYRNEGGFVPLGKKEKADDVPARLSKNEFVFTADAVRAAGGGDIDAGAEVMENVMKNLEAGGQVSEESQGAQGMYNNMKQLETRVA